jgi:hypothetical protein
MLVDLAKAMSKDGYMIVAKVTYENLVFVRKIGGLGKHQNWGSLG